MSRTFGSGLRSPIHSLTPGESIVLRGSYAAIKSSVCYVRRTRGWTLRQRKTERGIEVRRFA